MTEQFLRYLEFEKRYSVHTCTAYSEDLHQLFNFLFTTFEISEADQIAHTHLRSWIVQLMEDGLQPRSVNRKIATLKSFFKFLLARGYVTQNPANRLKPLKTSKPLPAFVKEAEMEHLLDKMIFTDDFFGLRDKLILELLYGTGMRLSELIQLQDSDFHTHQQVIKVLGKRNKERLIPIHDSLVHIIVAYQKSKRSMFEANYHNRLLVTDKGEQVYPAFVQRLVKRYLALVTTQQKKSPHVLRHTYATHLLNRGANLNAVKDLLGHSSLAATQVYTHNSIEKLKEAYKTAHPKA